MGGAEALEEQEGMANINLDQLLLNILMWEAGQKMLFLFGLLVLMLEVSVAFFPFNLSKKMTKLYRL
jgi:hypothetical protein